MKLSYAEDPEGVFAREESRRKKDLGIFEISEPHELLFSQGGFIKSKTVNRKNLLNICA